MEAEFDEEHGWVRYNPKESNTFEDNALINALQVKRRGRPPKVSA
jgi:hypothetical protein